MECSEQGKTETKTLSAVDLHVQSVATIRHCSLSNEMIIDVVDETNRVMGSADRSTVLASRLNFRTVHVLLFDQHGRLVLQHLPKDHPRSPGRLGSSVAGYLFAGETYEEAAARKSHEELNVSPGLREIGILCMQDEASHKFVGVFEGKLAGTVDFDRSVIDELVFEEIGNLTRDIGAEPERFTATFREVFRYFRETIN